MKITKYNDVHVIPNFEPQQETIQIQFNNKYTFTLQLTKSKISYLIIIHILLNS